MYEDIKAPVNFKEKAGYKAACVAILLNELSGISLEKAVHMVVVSRFGGMLRKEETKAWYSPAYWAYRDVCEEWQIVPDTGRDYYDFSKADTMISEMMTRLFPERL